MIINRPKSINGHELLKEQLLLFWGKFGGKKNNGDDWSQKDKMEELKRMADMVITYRKHRPIPSRREEFNQIKGKVHKFKTFWKCFRCGAPAKTRHHIVQLQNGGINSKKNLVSLCNPCHADIHPWLRH